MSKSKIKKSLSREFETLGTIIGYGLGVVTASLSFLRQARMFHPRGLVFEASVTSKMTDVFPLHNRALVRLSAAIWKNRLWPDVLGFSIRFTTTEDIDENVHENDQDLLFASFGSPFEMPIAPFITHYKNFLENEYFAVSPFEDTQGKKLWFKVRPHYSEIREGLRKTIIFNALKEGEAKFHLLVKEDNSKEWKTLGVIELEKESPIDQEALAFDPFQNGLGIRPVGFIHHLRKGAYRLSQMARPRFDSKLNNPVRIFAERMHSQPTL